MGLTSLDILQTDSNFFIYFNLIAMFILTELEFDQGQT
jgi:hypothetical protein